MRWSLLACCHLLLRGRVCALNVSACCLVSFKDPKLKSIRMGVLPLSFSKENGSYFLTNTLDGAQSFLQAQPATSAVGVRFGRIVVSEIEVPNMLANLV